MFSIDENKKKSLVVRFVKDESFLEDWIEN